MPVAVAKSAQVTSAATAIEPGTWRVATFSVVNSRPMMSERSTM